MFTVLFVDDNRRLREFWKQELERDGYRVLLAADGVVAVELLGREVPDLVVMDLHMPKMNGTTAIRQIQNKFPEIRVIFYSDERPDQGAYDLAQGWVRKLDEPTILKKKIVQILERNVTGQMEEGAVEP